MNTAEGELRRKNPFPGMNPYLEERWQDVHARLIVYIADQLSEKLPADLVARAEVQIGLKEGSGHGSLRPEVKVSEPHIFREPVAQALGSAGGRIARQAASGCLALGWLRS